MWSAQSPHIRFPEEGTWPTGKLPPLSLGGLKSQGLNKEMKRNLRKMDESPGQLPLLSSCIDDNREKERESARESEREGCACVCLCLSMWQTEAETLRAPDKKTHQVSVSWTARTLQHHQDNRGPHLGDLSQKAAARDLYDQTALTSPCRDRAVQARRFPLILWLALHSPGRATCSTRATRCLCRTDRLWFHKPCLIRHYRRASLPWHRWHRSRGAWPTLFARGWGRDALHVGAHHHPAQFLGPSR